MIESERFPDWVTELPEHMLDEASRFIVGKRGVVKNLFIALLAGGHVLLEGVPGVAKTHIAKTFANLLGCEYKRIQFTPDLLPVDIVGSFVFDQKTSEFKVRKGPIFANVVLIDEINRGLPRTQAGTIEAMQERQVTIDGQTFPLNEPFMVLATMNPVESQGVYPLTQAQVERFMFKLVLDYPSAEEEKQLLDCLDTIESSPVHPTTSAKKLRDLTTHVERVYVDEQVELYIVDLIRRTRSLKDLRLGASPRVIIHLYKACRAVALLEGRDYVLPDDVKQLLEPALAHRVLLTREAEIEGVKISDLITKLLQETPIPGIRAVDHAHENL